MKPLLCASLLLSILCGSTIVGHMLDFRGPLFDADGFCGTNNKRMACLDVGGQCVSDLSDPTSDACDDERCFYCALGQSRCFDTASGRHCQTEPDGTACANDDECTEPNGVVDSVSLVSCNARSVCQSEALRGAPNDACTSTIDCAGGLPCINGRCVGLQEGEPCFMDDNGGGNYTPTFGVDICAGPSLECYPNATTAVCRRTADVGQACIGRGVYNTNLQTPHCNTQGVCNSGLCIPFFSLGTTAVGQLSPDELPGLLGVPHVSNLYCQFGLEPDASSNSCVARSSSDLPRFYTPCSDSSQCSLEPPGRRNCTCNPFTGVQTCGGISSAQLQGEGFMQASSRCQELYDGLNDCLQAYDCALPGALAAPLTGSRCYESYCAEQWTCFRECVFEDWYQSLGLSDLCVDALQSPSCFIPLAELNMKETVVQFQNDGTFRSIPVHDMELMSDDYFGLYIRRFVERDAGGNEVNVVGLPGKTSDRWSSTFDGEGEFFAAKRSEESSEPDATYTFSTVLENGAEFTTTFEMAEKGREVEFGMKHVELEPYAVKNTMRLDSWPFGAGAATLTVELAPLVKSDTALDLLSFAEEKGENGRLTFVGRLPTNSEVLIHVGFVNRVLVGDEADTAQLDISYNLIGKVFEIRLAAVDASVSLTIDPDVVVVFEPEACTSDDDDGGGTIELVVAVCAVVAPLICTLCCCTIISPVILGMLLRTIVLEAQHKEEDNELEALVKTQLHRVRKQSTMLFSKRDMAAKSSRSSASTFAEEDSTTDSEEESS